MFNIYFRHIKRSQKKIKDLADRATEMFQQMK